MTYFWSIILYIILALEAEGTNIYLGGKLVMIPQMITGKI